MADVQTVAGGPFVTHLESALDGTKLAADTVQTTHRDRPLWVRYDLDAIGRAVTRETLRERPRTMWRYRELLPVGPAAHDIVSLQETVTPLVDCPRLAETLGIDRLWIKDESRLPTGSFKARGMAMAVSVARRFGVTRVAAPTAGNAGGALAAYAARAGMECFIFMPADTPAVNRYEAALHGARVFLVDGLISDCGRLVREGTEPMGWLDLSTLKEPYRLEGKKTMGLELAEQMGWELPDVILYPTGGGTGLVGMWKAFDELGHLGWLESQGRPRMFCCQSSGCAPLVTAFAKGREFAEPADDPHTVAAGLRVPAAVGDFMILQAVRASGGRAMAAEEDRLVEWMALASSLEGISLCPEAAACVGVLERAVADGLIRPAESAVLFNTGAAQKYVEVMQVELPMLDLAEPPDWSVLAGGRGAR
ncbi:MAG: threonine synthase [Planctomycetota bacterium]|jgi:threonine synthase